MTSRQHSFVPYSGSVDCSEEDDTQPIRLSAVTQPSAILPSTPRTEQGDSYASNSGCATRAASPQPPGRTGFLFASISWLSVIIHRALLWLVDMLTPMSDVRWCERRVINAAVIACAAESGMWDGLVSPLERNLARAELELAVYRLRAEQDKMPLTREQVVAEARRAEAGRLSLERTGRAPRR